MGYNKNIIPSATHCVGYNHIHTENCYTDMEPLFLNSSDCFTKVQTADITVNVGLSKYLSFCMGNLKLND